MKKILMFLLIMMLVLTACSKDQPSGDPDDQSAETEEGKEPEIDPQKERGIELTADQLLEFDGKEGRRAYISVAGVIYDVSDSLLWKGGFHNGIEAGGVYGDPKSEGAPHGMSMLKRVRAIGHLVEGSSEMDEDTDKEEAAETENKVMEESADVETADTDESSEEAADTDDEMKEDMDEDKMIDTTVEHPTIDPETERGIELTPEELALFTGKDGNRAYISVEGVIYDMSDSLLWKGGIHNGIEAGGVYGDPKSEGAPHGMKMLLRVRAIGHLVEESMNLDNDTHETADNDEEAA